MELVALCLKLGVSIARAAMDRDVNPNQLRRWIVLLAADPARFPRAPLEINGVQIDIPTPTDKSPGNTRTLPAVVYVVSAPESPWTPSTPVTAMALALHVRLPNDVELDFGDARVEQKTAIQMLGRLAFSASTKV